MLFRSKHDKHCATEENDEGQIVGERTEVGGGEAGYGALIVLRDQNGKRERKSGQQHPKQDPMHA